MNHEWDIGSEISAHIHMVNKSTNAADRFVKFTLEYSWADISGNVTSPITVSNNFIIPGGDPINTHYYVELFNGGLIPPLSVVSGQFMAVLTIVTATGTAPASDPIVLNLGMHGYVNSLGSREEYVK